MTIALESVGKKFGREWIFRQLSYTFEQGKQYACTGHNGSGKSTLLKLVSGSAPCSEGRIAYQHQGNTIAADDIFSHVALVAPYTALIEEFTLEELLAFYRKFKPLALSNEAFADKIALAQAKYKPIQHYSSGMKQRLQLALALYSESSLLLLDEPTSNLDQQNTAWYQQEIVGVGNHRTVIISSNQPHEYGHCHATLDIRNWKPS